MALGEIIQRSKAKIANLLHRAIDFSVNIVSRLYRPLDNIYKKISPPFEKAYNKNKASIWQAILVMAAMGWFPLGWVALGIFLTVYAAVKIRKIIWHKRLFLVKYSSIINNIKAFIVGSREERENDRALNRNTFFLWHHILQWLGNKLNNAPLAILKFCLSAYIVLVSGMPWCLFVVYALYRPETEVLEEIYRQVQSSVAQFYAFFKQLTNVKKMIFTMLGASFCVTIIKSILFNGVLLGIFDAGMFVLMLGLTVAGIRLAFKDFIQGTKTPIKFFAGKIGIIIGIIEGNRLAHLIFYGKISGTLGHAYGAVHSSSLFSSLYGLFASNNPFTYSAFQFKNTLLGGLFNRISVAFGGFLGNIFFTYDVSTYGYFYGTLGPTSLQLFLFMVIGGAVGYCIDKLVTRLARSIKPDLDQIWDNDPNTPSYSKRVKYVKQAVKLLNKYRSPIVMIPLTIMTFLIAQMSILFLLPYIVTILAAATLFAPVLVGWHLFNKFKKPISKPKPPILLLTFDPSTLIPQPAVRSADIRSEVLEPSELVIVEPSIEAEAESVKERLATMLSQEGPTQTVSEEPEMENEKAVPVIMYGSMVQSSNEEGSLPTNVLPTSEESLSKNNPK